MRRQNFKFREPLPAQPVDATPPDINLFLKGGVHMQRRWKLSSAQRADMWRRWKAGESLNAIGRILGKDKQVIHFLLARHGGIALPVRRRGPHALTLAEREEISRGIASGASIRGMAKGLKRAVSTVSRVVALAGDLSIEPVKPIGRPGSRLCGASR